MLKSIYKNLVGEKVRIIILNGIKRLKWFLFFRGNELSCNICDKSSNQFLDKNGRAQAECPYCGSLERHRSLWNELTKQDDFYTKSILHIAPFSGIQQNLIERKINYVDVDINPNMARFQEDIRNLSFDSNHFDLIICSHVLSHIDDEPKALRELHRVLKVNGHLWILTGIKREKSTIIDERSVIHQGESGRSNEKIFKLHGIDFANDLGTYGFDVTRMENKDYPLSENEAFFNCKKIEA